MDEALIKNIKEPEERKMTAEDWLDLERIDFMNMLEELEGK